MWFLGAQKLSFSALRNVSSRDVVLGHTTTPLLCGQQWWENNSSPPALLNVLEKKYRPSEKNLYLASFYYYTWKIHVFLCVVTTCLLYFTKINCTVCSTAFKFAKKKTDQTNKHNFTAFQNILLFSIFQDLVFTKYLTVYASIITESLKQFSLICCWFCILAGKPKGKWCYKYTVVLPYLWWL